MSCMYDPATTLTSDGGFKNGLENTSDGVSNLNTLVTTVVKINMCTIVAIKAILHNYYYCTTTTNNNNTILTMLPAERGGGHISLGGG